MLRAVLVVADAPGDEVDRARDCEGTITARSVTNRSARAHVAAAVGELLACAASARWISVSSPGSQNSGQLELLADPGRSSGSSETI